MNRARTACTVLLVLLLGIGTNAQTSPSQHAVSNSTANAPAERTIAHSVPTGTPLQIALDREVRVKRQGRQFMPDSYSRCMPSISWFCQRASK
jgi:hypothetical protein